MKVSCPFKMYKNLFGEIGKGAHKYRLLNTAIVDYILTIIGAFITTYYTTIPLTLTTLFWFTLSLILHILFGVETESVKFLGIKCV